MSRVFLTPAGHLVTWCREVPRSWGRQIVGVEWHPTDVGTRQQYAREFDAARCVEVTDQIVRVSCLGCRVEAQSFPEVAALVARPHGPLEPSGGV